jgi:hypothetical protein
LSGEPKIQIAVPDKIKEVERGRTIQGGLLTAEIDGHLYQMMVDTSMHSSKIGRLVVIPVDSVPCFVSFQASCTIEPVAVIVGADVLWVIMNLVWVGVIYSDIQRTSIDGGRERD